MKFESCLAISIISLFCLLGFTFWPNEILNTVTFSVSYTDTDYPVEKVDFMEMDVYEKIDNLRDHLEVLRRNNLQIRAILSQAIGKSEGINETKLMNLSEVNLGEPEESYEKTRRILEIHLKELWYNLRSQQGKLSPDDFSQLQDVYRILRSHVYKLRLEDGYEKFREKETAELASLVQNRIRILQNPRRCSTAKKVVCQLNKQCGFGCQIHHVVYCLISAYATGRTLILESQFWKYDSQGWEHLFLPVSKTCTTIGSAFPETVSGSIFHRKSLVIKLPYVESLGFTPKYLPVSIPADIANRLEKVHGEPQIWWVGQFVKYILRLQPRFQKKIENYIKKLGVDSPTVGIHVRRTDKLHLEASFHSLKEYMEHTKEYFDIVDKVHGNRAVKRRVFVASDDPGVILEARANYSEPEWTIVGSTEVAESAAEDKRFHVAGLTGIIKDVFALAACDYLVCTFSSQICRLAYELMQSKHADASGRFVSLDDSYYYGGGNGVIEIAAAPHIPRNDQEIELKIGDRIHVEGNHWNGLSKGENLRTRKRGLYPSYKGTKLIQKVPFPKTKWWLPTMAP